MAVAAMNRIVDQIYRLAGPGSVAQTDRQLLEQFISRQEQAAFTALVRRHGPMVFGVCKRILEHQQDAEDAFQATFLVLARRADAVSWQESIANWLYGVAHRVSLKLRGAKARRPECALVNQTALPSHETPRTQWPEVLPLLDEELQRLPAKYRAPLVLCYLEGKSRAEAAQQLGWTLPTVKGRLERGRNLLRHRLTRRGLTMSATTFPGAFGACAFSAGVPATLVRETSTMGFCAAFGHVLSNSISSQATTLAEGVFTTMVATKMKMTVVAVVLAAVCAVGVGFISHHAAANNRNLESPAAAEEREGEGREGKDAIRGVVKAIDLDRGVVTLTISRDGEERRDVKFSLAGKNVKVVYSNERAANIKNVTPGARVSLFLSDVEEVGRIVIQARGGDERRGGERERPRRRFLAGTVKSVTAKGEKKIITLTFADVGGRYDRTFTLAPGARMLVREREEPIKEIKIGEKVAVAFDDAKRVVLVRYVPGTDEDGGRERETQALIGELVSIDAEKRTITILQRRDAGPVKHTISVSKEARIFAAGERPVKLGDLDKGGRYQIRFGRDGKTAVVIFPFRPRPERRFNARGKVKAVDVKKRTITIAFPGEDGTVRKRTFSVSQEARIVAGGKERAELADVKVGTLVQLQVTRDRQTVVNIRPFRRERDRDEN